MSMETISPDEAASYVGRNDVLFIDMREEKEYKDGHIPGAVWMEADEVRQRRNWLEQFSTVILYCERGNASLLMARELNDCKTEIKSIAFGMSEYRGPRKKGVFG